MQLFENLFYAYHKIIPTIPRDPSDSISQAVFRLLEHEAFVA